MSGNFEKIPIRFSIDGKWLTNFARTLWADEESPEKAMRILKTAFPSMREEDIFAILIGKKKLIGNSKNGILLKSDDTKKSKHGNSLDLKDIISRFKIKIEALDDWNQIYSGNTVIVSSTKGLVQIPKKYAKIGSNLRYYLNDNVNLENIPHRKIDRQEANSIGIFNQLESDSFDSVVKIELKFEFGITNDTGWLSPDGKFYPCSYMEHVAVACELGYDEGQLERLGWIKIQSGVVIAPLRNYDNVCEITQKQYDLIYDWCREMGREFPAWITN